jgi:mono/diheme cytochrome c family protein
MVHLPIGLILLVPVLEILGLAPDRRYLKAAARLVLGLATGAALLAAANGWLLAWSGGYKGPVVIQHMWGGMMFAGLCMICCTVRWSALSQRAGPDRGTAAKALEASATRSVDPVGLESGIGSKAGILYSLSLLATLGMLAWASHLGGKLSHGDNYLTQYLPRMLRGMFQREELKTKPVATVAGVDGLPTVYARQIQPIWDESCVSCHGPDKVKGGLRMDTFVALMKGGDKGIDVVPWQPAKSELLRRVKIHPDDDDFMPSNGKKVLTDAQKTLIENWIAAGASDHQPLLDR